MLIYCDRLTLAVCINLIGLRVRGLIRNRPNCVQVLDTVPSNVWNRTLIAVMKLLGVRVEEAQFFAGHLKTSAGQAVSMAAGRWAQDTTFKAAEEVVESSSFLSDLNNVWGRNTVRLHLAKKFWNPMLDAGMRIFVASALARNAGANSAIVIVTRPTDFPSSYLINICPNLELRFHSPGISLIRTGRLYLLLWLIRNQFLELKWRTEAQIERLLGHSTPCSIEDHGPNSILLMQESEVSLDRSYRTQPHWLFETESHPNFRTYIVEDLSFTTEPIDEVGLKDRGICLVSKKDIALIRRRRPPLPVQVRLSEASRQCFFKTLLGRSGAQTAATARLSLLFSVAIRMTDFCRQANIKAFMTCENYHTEVDAVQLLAPELGIRTISYQFANTHSIGPVTSTNGDCMLTISALYHQQYSKHGIRPISLVDIGYPFETSFELVRERAQTCRAKMEKAGAKFIICYFDENSAKQKYGNVGPADNVRNLIALMRLVLDDPSVGLVLKTKLIRTSPRHLDEISEVRESVEATGRYVELLHGNRRNITFPAEAALCSDIAIGLADGTTAVLEAALTGTRGILLNPYGRTGSNDAIYAKADIVYPSVVEALKAINAFRSGAPERPNLGDWSGIIDQFDPVRDGQAAHRMRAALEQAMMGEGTPTPNLVEEVKT